MCRSIKTLHNFQPPATDEEIRASSLDRPSIAVLPFREPDISEGSSYFGDGIVEDIIGALACLGTWRIILWPVWASRFIRGSGSHAGRHAASERGSPRIPIISPHCPLST
jgi:hypothetical protein